MGWDTPDDWNRYYTRCPRCNTRYHASEGGCGCTEDLDLCAGPCAEYHQPESLTTTAASGVEQHLCEDCLVCDICQAPATAWDTEACLWICTECATKYAAEDAANGLPPATLNPIEAEVTA